MNLRWITVLLAVLLASCAAPSAENLAFRETCLLSRYNCTGIAPPLVRITPLTARAGLYGVYFGGRTIWLSHTLATPEERYVVMTHEMTHYLQTQVDGNGVPFLTLFEKCVYEEEAYEVSNVVAQRLKQPHLINTNLSGYSCGAP